MDTKVGFMDRPALDKAYRDVEDLDVREKLEKQAPFNADAWICWFNYHQTAQNSDGVRCMRKLVQYQTVAYCEKLKYPLPGKLVPICADMAVVQKQIKASKFYDFTQIHTFKTDIPSPGHVLDIGVMNCDCLEGALFMKEKGLNPLVLNMASDRRPGGGWKNGAGAQEENIFRRSNYFQVLTDDQKANGWGYPLPEFSAVYSPSVFVFRDSEAKGYGLLDQPIELSFIATAAYRKPPLHGKEMKLPSKFEDGTKKKIRIMLHLARVHGHDSLLLSAFGCGAFKNPALHMAQLFKAVIEEPEWQGYFKSIYFGIIESDASKNKVNKDGNFAPFKETIGLCREAPTHSKPKRESSPPRRSCIDAPLKAKPVAASADQETIRFNLAGDMHGYLSPDFKCKLSIDGQRFWSVTHYLTWKKYEQCSPKISQQIRDCTNLNGLQAFSGFTLRTDWDVVGPQFHRQATQLKFQLNVHLLELLKETGTTKLVYIPDPQNEAGQFCEEVRDATPQ